MSAIEWAAAIILLLHAVLWPQTSSNLLVQKLRGRFRRVNTALGLSHSWHMFCQTDWTHTARLKVEVKNEAGQTIRVIEPLNYMEKKWFAELAILKAPPPEVLRSMLEYYRRESNGDAVQFALVKTVGRRPPTPSAWFENFGTESTAVRTFTVAQLVRHGSNWKFTLASHK